MTRPEVRLTITPGIARVNAVCLAHSSPDIVCIEIDMHTKRAIVDGGGAAVRRCGGAVGM